MGRVAIEARSVSSVSPDDRLTISQRFHEFSVLMNCYRIKKPDQEGIITCITDHTEGTKRTFLPFELSQALTDIFIAKDEKDNVRTGLQQKILANFPRRKK